MTSTIVVGVDASESAAVAARTAAEVAESFGAELRVISAYGRFEVDTFSSGGEEFTVTTQDHAQRTAEAVVADLRAARPHVTMTAEAKQGKPADVLVSEADRLGARLVVVGNKRVQGPTRVLGSIATAVASRAGCDVYIAHTHPRG